ncbi:prepilin peptidase [Pseudidiomarina aestuarii]|uniref:Prepilin leader peptidase/N-methyltransferase n=2 Tax=Pseudidiomarina aestuarii TaxID=624146 RepID=A0A7Z7EUL8_9GAMM|nr:prepilin peptidase [Pseudidiomarina aestuarii]
MTLYAAHTPWAAAFGIAFGLIVGSFLNVVIGRYPVMMQRQWRAECAQLQEQELPKAEPFNLATPHSRCPKCQSAIRWYDNIPVLSWLLLRAKCRSCGTTISARYPLIESLTGAVFGVLAWQFGMSVDVGIYMLLAALLIVLFFIDLDHMLLPDPFTLFALWLGLGYAIYGGPVSLQDAVIGAMAGYLFLWSVYWIFKLLTGKEGMGYGDFKLLAALGAWTGFQYLPVIIIAAAGSGAILGLTLQWLRKTKAGQPIPFGPFLICGGVITMVWGELILSTYWSWLAR